MDRTCENCIYFENLYTIGPVGGPCYTCVWNCNFVPKEDNDSVSHPNHYQSKSGLEVIDVVRTFTEDLTGVESFYTGNILKYMCRWKKKNGLEDLKKARQYLDWLIEIEDLHMTEEDAKRVLNRIYGVGKNGRYSMNDTDCCYEECTRKSKKEDCFVPSYKFDNSLIEKQVAVEIIWDQFCDAFLKALTEVSEEEKEKKDEK